MILCSVKKDENGDPLGGSLKCVISFEFLFRPTESDRAHTHIHSAARLKLCRWSTFLARQQHITEGAVGAEKANFFTPEFRHLLSDAAAVSVDEIFTSSRAKARLE